MSEKQTQTARLLEYQRQHGSITPMQAWNELGIYRLAARVSDLQAQGHAILAERVTVQNRHGEPCRVAEYRMAQAGGTA